MGSCDWALGSLTAGHSWSPKRGVRGCDSAERPPADKAPALFPHLARKLEKWQPIGPKPATRRQARSRWRPDDRKVVRRRDRTAKRIAQGAQKAPDSRAIWKSNAGGFPTVDRRAVSRGDVSTWVLVTRNVGCRNGFEASWRCVQGKAAKPHEAQSRAMDEIDVPDGARRLSSSQKGC